MKPYEGMPAYEAGVEEGKRQAVVHFSEAYSPIILEMLELISKNSNEDLIVEMANDCYNYIKGNGFEKSMRYKE